ncbi:MAG: TonB-dependent receptor plug domain-containing protein, partial [Ginsengibacter sp.]
MRLKLTLYRLCTLAVILLFCNIASAQKLVTGTVTDGSGKPVVGATVVVRGSNVGTQTDASGKFSVTAPSFNSRLIISSVGFEQTEISINGKNDFDVSLRTSTSTLNEVVVTGYTSQRKKEITGAVSVVNVGQLKQTTASTGEEALQGRASGINVISSGQPGAASDIRIRGITGFGNNSPLIIVDGVRGDIHNINVNDIESVQILKDASAAIYGIAGSNGVIIVTTKRGKTGKAKVSY